MVVLQLCVVEKDKENGYEGTGLVWWRMKYAFLFWRENTNYHHYHAHYHYHYHHHHYYYHHHHHTIINRNLHHHHHHHQSQSPYHNQQHHHLCHHHRNHLTIKIIIIIITHHLDRFHKQLEKNVYCLKRFGFENLNCLANSFSRNIPGFQSSITWIKWFVLQKEHTMITFKGYRIFNTYIA